jgi:MFS family permease
LGQGLGVLLLLNASSVFDFYLFAILWAIPYGGEGTSFPVINRQYYGHMPMGTIYGWQLLGAGLGMALGGILPGLTFDMSGNYTIAIYFSSAFSLFGAIIILFLKSTNKSIIPNWPEIEPSKS